jgi:type IV secretory pathway VirD2 relaxase
MTAPASDHLELSARLGTRQRRRHAPLPRLARGGRWGARHVGGRRGRGQAWVAIDHYNTDNPHVHLLVRGLDARGQALQIHPDYVKQGIRGRSQDLATQGLGYRSEREIVESRGQVVERLRFTDLDRALIQQG